MVLAIWQQPGWDVAGWDLLQKRWLRSSVWWFDQKHISGTNTNHRFGHRLGIEIIHSVVHNHFQPDFSKGFCLAKAMRRFIGLSLTLLTTFAKEQDIYSADWSRCFCRVGSTWSFPGRENLIVISSPFYFGKKCMPFIFFSQEIACPDGKDRTVLKEKQFHYPKEAFRKWNFQVSHPRFPAHPAILERIVPRDDCRLCRWCFHVGCTLKAKNCGPVSHSPDGSMVSYWLRQHAVFCPWRSEAEDFFVFFYVGWLAWLNHCCLWKVPTICPRCRHLESRNINGLQSRSWKGYAVMEWDSSKHFFAVGVLELSRRLLRLWNCFLIRSFS